MRLLPVWMLAVAGWVAAAAPGLRSDDDPQGENLGPALRELARRKRATSKSNIPYSNYRPLTGIHRPYSGWRHISRVRRYRYPLYRKRSYQPQQYDYEEDVLLPEVEGDFSDYEDYVQRPSLFRERNVQQQQERKKKELLMEDDGYFTDDYAPERAALNPNRVPLRKKDYLYHLYNMPPSDLERLNYMYEIGKRDSDLLSPYDLAALEQMHAVGRKTVAPSSTEQFYNAIDSVRKKKAMYGANPAAEAAASDHLQKLKNYLTTAAGRYLEQQEAAAAARDPMIRRKRDTTSSAVGAPAAATKTNSSLATAPTTTSSSPYHPSDQALRNHSHPLPGARRRRPQEARLQRLLQVGEAGRRLQGHVRLPDAGILQDHRAQRRPEEEEEDGVRAVRGREAIIRHRGVPREPVHAQVHADQTQRDGRGGSQGGAGRAQERRRWQRHSQTHRQHRGQAGRPGAHARSPESTAAGAGAGGTRPQEEGLGKRGSLRRFEPGAQGRAGGQEASPGRQEEEVWRG
ncbi:uncharacterized protein [Panulirus ornatus]|uniref:uncharacterized protein n=1 Tax=Panulirus ornatus TaxID=150431 RepID=UPI003A8802C4